MTKAADILRAARKLIERPENWMQGYYHNADPAHATCFCPLGALYAATNTDVACGTLEHHPAMLALLKAIGGHTEGWLAVWNDMLERTHAEVLDAFTRAIAIAEGAAP